ncbi:ABC transporter ATP-binding protein [Streptomyces sp. NBC_00264]|uniref:ABC transporter ATP-binding protein n=1 Tax=unclassified Streptomyces TaxID=2593676 RepID=UPI002250DE0A|nr:MULTISPECIES: ABC transporter ATP-binding protein [unclassified Streptomyces]WSG54485.1 ABC transporter ATP-binding protein [Streptomyces sp. NBC_01732]WSX05203.1 ABC transporter ATP-binding protein [Streptomyces sp. NBC_00987]MCX4392569.1 ABC transporter ATP-binding protein [Streptomyces sp. NBC_01767]MCX5104700.1 ABC transporter ATP-binding protein [Streptomyces sp. NBC_00439]MCX5164250.1 ABC transporter ATP-binding protein [Streptomyces sp. NBC_00305]
MADAITPDDGSVAWALEARGLGKRYRRGWALRDISFRLPAGRICGLVGPNGAGKSTLLGIATRQVQPTEGDLRIFGVPVDDPEVMPKFAFLGQEKPLFKRFTVAETLRMGAELNPGWDMAAAERIVRSGQVPMDARVGTLSGGQRTRVAFALAFGKRPDLLLLDEPMSDLDPLARHDMSTLLMSEAVERGTTVVMSSHMLSELEDMCDYLLVLAGGRIRMAGDADALVPAHALVTGLATDGDTAAALAPHTVIECRVQGRQFHALVRPNGPLSGDWVVAEPSLEEVLLAHLRAPDAPPLFTPGARIEAEGSHTS